MMMVCVGSYIPKPWKCEKLGVVGNETYDSSIPKNRKKQHTYFLPILVTM